MYEREGTLRGMLLQVTRDSDKDAAIGNDIEFIEFVEDDELAEYVTSYKDQNGKEHEVIGDEPFAILLADDLLDANPPVMKQMTDVFDEHQCSVIGVLDVPRAETRSYGIVKSSYVSERLERFEGVVEKPKPEEAPSTLAVVGRYILTPRIFHHLENVKPGAGGEIQLTDGMAALLAEEQVLAYRYLGKRYDCGSKLGYLEATVDFGRRHPEVGADFSNYLKTLEHA